MALTGAFWIAYLLILVVTGKAKALVPEPMQPLLWGLASSALILVTTLVFVRRDGRALRDVGLVAERSTILRLSFGLGVGLLVFGLTILAVALLSSGLRFERPAIPTGGALFFVLTGTLATSCMEELGFRAYPLRTLLEGFRAWQAQVLVAVAFGLCHIAFGWSWVTVLLGVIPSALLFGLAAVASGGIAVPVGIHAGLNLAQWSVGEHGLWRIASTPEAGDDVSRLASVIGLSITLLAAFLFWLRIPKLEEAGGPVKPRA